MTSDNCLELSGEVSVSSDTVCGGQVPPRPPAAITRLDSHQTLPLVSAAVSGKGIHGDWLEWGRYCQRFISSWVIHFPVLWLDSGLLLGLFFFGLCLCMVPGCRFL